MKTVLALDLGTLCGFAVGAADDSGKPSVVVRGSWDFSFTAAEKKANKLPPGRRHFDGGGARYAKFEARLAKLHAAMPFEAIFFEEIRRHKGVIAAQVHGGLLATMQAWADRQDPPVPYRGVTVQAIKSYATGKGNASKGEMLLAVERLGFPCDDDNEADAVALLLLKLREGAALSAKEG